MTKKTVPTELPLKRHTDALRNFDDLPGSALIRPQVAKVLLGVSSATVWRWCGEERLHPVKIAPGTTGFRASELRSLLAGKAA